MAKQKNLLSVEALRELPELVINVKGYTKTRFNLSEELVLTNESLDYNIDSHCEQRGFWELALVYANENLQTITEEKDHVHRNLYLDYRAELIGLSQTFTEFTLQAYAKTHKEYLDAQDDLFDAKHQVSIIEAVCKALEARTAMLASKTTLLT